MNQRKWKKIIGIFLILGMLVLSFWYGGNAPGLQGFSVSDKAVQSSVENNVDGVQGARSSDGKAYGSGTKYDDNSDNVISESDSESLSEDRNSAENMKNGSDAEKTVREKKDSSKEKKTGFFERIVMKVKKISSSGSKKKNLQINKKAQRNANKAVDKSKKSKKKKSIASNNDTDSNKSSKASVSNNSLSDSSNESGNDNNSKNSDNDSDNSAGNGDDNRGLQQDLANQTDKTELQNATEKTQSSENTTETDNSNDKGDKESKKEDDTGGITCNIYISCASVLNHMDKLNASTKKVIPEDGVILNLTTVKVKQGATVFDVLQKAARDNQVHLEYNYTPAYKTYYIEGIGNLYQFDAGNLSGWMYSVNGEFPGVGCSGYKVKDGDSINWLYTCSFGKDVGGYVAE